MYVKIEGTWHKANEDQTATICGLDPQDVDAARLDDGGPAPLGSRCRICITDT